MKSPFPGMDPYLEPHWLDVHATLIGEARRALNRSLPPGLVARAEERVAVESDDKRLHRIGPDVRVFTPSTADPAEGAGGTIVIEAPFKLVVDVDPITERFLRIIDEEGALISVIEFISPRNKRQPGLGEFRAKREELLSGGVHVVEVDLVRSGDWRSLMRPEVCPPEAVSTYRATVRTARPRPVAYLFPIALRDPLPEIPVPLRPTDEPAKLRLQDLIDAVYADGRYDQTIDYARSLVEPALQGEEAAWVEEMLRSRRGS
jgi:hypothetical protein